MRTKHIGIALLLAVLFGAASVAVHAWVRQNRQGELVDAAFVGDLTTVKRCVHAGANLDKGPRTPDGGCTLPPITIAASAGHAPVVRYLLDHGANPNLRGMSNPLIAACWRRHYKVAKLLLERGADPNARGEGTPLYAAESTNQPELVVLRIRLRVHA